VIGDEMMKKIKLAWSHAGNRIKEEKDWKL
jgi:hypothetical protein